MWTTCRLELNPQMFGDELKEEGLVFVSNFDGGNPRPHTWTFD